jgi:hypothetical protein
MNRTSCDDDTMPISIAMRIAAGSVVSVLNHSCITALMASRSYISPRGARVVRKLESPSCDAFWKEAFWKTGDGRRETVRRRSRRIRRDSPPRRKTSYGNVVAPRKNSGGTSALRAFGATFASFVARASRG